MVSKLLCKRFEGSPAAQVKFTEGLPYTVYGYGGSEQAETYLVEDDLGCVSEVALQGDYHEFTALSVADIFLGGEPVWEQAPVWASYWVVNERGISFWFEHKPYIDRLLGGWVAFKGGLSEKTGQISSEAGWFNSIRRHPELLKEQN